MFFCVCHTVTPFYRKGCITLNNFFPRPKIFNHKFKKFLFWGNFGPKNNFLIKKESFFSDRKSKIDVTHNLLILYRKKKGKFLSR